MLPLAAPNSGYCRPFFACQRIEGYYALRAFCYKPLWRARYLVIYTDNYIIK